MKAQLDAYLRKGRCEFGPHWQENGCAAHSKLEVGTNYGTIDLHVKMLRPVPQEQELIGDAHVAILRP